MNREEWGEMLGDKMTVQDDLRWTLFQAERSITRMMKEDSAASVDHEIIELNLARVRDAKIALAALWRYLYGDVVVVGLGLDGFVGLVGPSAGRRQWAAERTNAEKTRHGS